MDSPRISFVVRLLAIVLIPLVFYLLADAPNRAIAYAVIPVLVVLSTPLLLVILALHVAAVLALNAADLGQPVDVLAAATLFSALAFAARRNLLVRPPETLVRPWTWAARHAATLRGLALGAVPILSAFALFRGYSWVAYPALALGYYGLNRYLARFAARIVASRRVALLNALVLLVSVVASFAVLDFAVGHLVRIPPPPAVMGNLMVANDTSLWSPRPNFDATFSYSIQGGPRTEFTVRHSAAGFRGEDVGPKSADEFRVVMMGDSFTYGWNVSQEETIPAQLQTRLREMAPGRTIHVINLGVPAYSPWQELAFLRERGLALQPDLVVVQLFPSNDIPESISKFGRLLPAHGEFEMNNLTQWRKQATWPWRVERGLRSASAVYDAYRARGAAFGGVPALVRQFRFSGPPAPVMQESGESKRIFWLETLLTDWYPDLELAWQECRRDVNEMVSSCRANGVPVLVYAVPMAAFTRAQLDGYIADSIRKSGEAIAYEPGKDMRVMREFFTANNLPWMDLEPQLAATPDPSSLFIPGDGHFNPKGCRLVADAIATRIAADGYLHPPPDQ